MYNNGYVALAMKTKKRLKAGDIAGFRVTPGALKVINDWTEKGYSYSTLVNAALSLHGQQVGEQLIARWSEFGMAPKPGLAAAN